MPTTRSGRLLFFLIVFACLCVIGRNFYRRHLDERLYAAVERSDLPAVRDLVARHADINYIHPREDMSLKIPAGANASDYQDSVLKTAMARLSGPFLATSPSGAQDAETIACLLIRSGVHLGAHGERGVDYLRTACFAGRTAIIRCLLDRGVDLNKHDVASGTAVDSAILYTTAYQQSNAQKQKDRLACTRQMVQILRERGARITVAQAVQVDDNALLKSVLNAGESAKQSNQSEQPALCLAAEKQNTEAVKLLLAHEADVNAHYVTSSYIGETALCTAAYGGNKRLVELLLTHGANVNFRANYTTPLLSAANGKRPDIFRLLLAQGADPKLTPLNRAVNSVLAVAIGNIPQVVPELLQRGADINGMDGDTLKAAIRSHRLDLVREFLRLGVAVNRSLASGGPHYAPMYQYVGSLGEYHLSPLSPLGIAVCEAPECEVLLLEAGAKLGPDVPTILAAAAHAGRAALFARLMALGADVNGADTEKETALTHAILYAPEGVETLLKGGANPNYVNRRQRTPLDMAAGAGKLEAVRLLLAHGANVNAHPLRAHTALYYARKKQNTAIIALLEKAGATDDR